MARRVRRSQLVARLQSVPDFPAPQPRLEQYRTPPQIVADLLWEAQEDGAIQGRHVLDLGCGTGIFSLGAHLLGAASVTGVDADPGALQVAGSVVPGTFVEADVAGWEPPRTFDTVVMNPPFGAQSRGADRPFYTCAARAVDHDGTCWFLAQPKTERFLAAQARELGADLERVRAWDYPIEARFAFHDQAVQVFHVAGYRMAWD